MFHPRIISIASSKGGSGKTTAALNLGVSLTHLGKDVTVVDSNLHNPNIGLHLGAPQVPIHLNHVLNDKYHISEAVYRHKSGLKIVPASLSFRDMHTSLANLKGHLKQLETDYVLVDSPSGFHDNSIHAISSADEILVVTQPELPAVSDALKTIRLARSLGIGCRGVIVNKTGSRHDMKTREIESFLGSKVLASVPFDSNVRFSLRTREPLAHLDPESPASVAFRELAAYLTGYS
ncbi:MAG: P-loop NTPase, partial [Nanoarchaeota archaeon]